MLIWNIKFVLSVLDRELPFGKKWSHPITKVVISFSLVYLTFLSSFYFGELVKITENVLALHSH